MSSINSKPPTLDGKEKDTVGDCFVRYLTSNENIVVQMMYPGSWTATPVGDTYGYNVTTTTVMDATTITFDFTQADYTQTATFTFTNSDPGGSTYQVTMSGPPPT